MYVEHLSPGYWVTELDIIEWEEDHAAMDPADHAALAEFVYGCADHPLLVKEQRHSHTHLPVYPEGSIPQETLVVPSEPETAVTTREIILVAKRSHAANLFRMMRGDL